VRSPYAYFLSNRTYTTFCTDATGFPNGDVRLLRYVVSNPTSAPVAVNTAFAGSATASETWRRYKSFQFSGNPTADGFSYPSYVYVPNVAGANFPNANCNSSTHSALHRYGTGVYYECAAAADYPWGVSVDGTLGAYPWIVPYSGVVDYPAWSQSTGALRFSAFLNPVDSATETQPASTTADGFPIVPAASNGTPGRIVIYLARPFSARAIDNTAYDGQADAIVWVFQDINGGRTNREYYAWRVDRRLVGASESINGTLSMTPRPVLGTAVVGAPGPAFSEALNATLTNH
jgi:hypothetical protein